MAGGMARSSTRRTEAARQRTTGAALIVSSSPANRIILSNSLKLVKCRPQFMDPSGPAGDLDGADVSVAVLDETGGESASDQLVDALIRLRDSRGDGLPRIIIIARQKPFDGTVKLAMAANAIITLPLTPEKIQCTVTDLLQDFSTH